MNGRKPGRDLSKVTRKTFEPAVGSTFRMLVSNEATVDLELVSVKELGTRDRKGRRVGRRQAFSLLFRGPRDAPVPQGLYRLEHENLGPMDIFIVPIGPNESGPRYEAIFN